MKLVTIKTFTDTPEANIIKGHLESEGIKCFLKNENIVNADLALSTAVGGVELQVEEGDRERALEICGM